MERPPKKEKVQTIFQPREVEKIEVAARIAGISEASFTDKVHFFVLQGAETHLRRATASEASNG